MYWLTKDAWSEHETVWLMCGKNPEAEDNAPLTAQYNHAAETLRRAVLMKKLPCVAPIDAEPGDRMYGHHRFFVPAEVVRWANGKLPDFPFHPGDFAESEALQDASAPRAPHTLSITGPTYAKLLNAIEAFDPNKPPRSKKAFMGVLESLGCLTREQDVFAKIVAEHYGHTWRS